jgi:hypothetical protein
MAEGEFDLLYERFDVLAKKINFINIKKLNILKVINKIGSTCFRKTILLNTNYPNKSKNIRFNLKFNPII